MNTSLVRIVALCLGTLVIATASADFEAGVAANRNGDRATAFSEFQSAARDGDNRAYGKLASMYLYGLGTEKNYQQAYVWFQMAYLAGEKEAERFRNAAASMLTREELTQAEQAAETQRIELSLESNPAQKQ